MAELWVGQFAFHLESVRTESVKVQPVLDAAGNYECHKITLSLVGIVTKIALATRKNQPLGRVGPGNLGDSLPVTMFYLNNYLMRPRQRILYRVQDTDVLVSPRPLPDGTYLESDAKGGPYPVEANFTQLSGDKIGILTFVVETYDTYCDNVLISNAWQATSDTDQYGFTTRTISGRAAFRRDLLDQTTFVPDDFRPFLFVPGPENMRRVNVSVTVNEAGNEARYVVVDKEVTAGLGESSDIKEVIGTVSATLDRPIRDFKGAMQQLGDAIANVRKAFGGDLPGAISGITGQVFHNLVPSNYNIGVCRCIGQKRVDRAKLARVATAILVDRFRPILPVGFRTGIIASATMVHNFDSDNPPYAEAKIVAMTFGNQILGQILEFDVNPGTFFNTSNFINQGDALPLVGPGQTAPRLPNSSNSRGTDLHRLLTQSLQAPPATVADFGDQLPDDPPANEDALDVGPL